MSVYIKGLDIDSAKKNGEVIIIYPSGVVMAEGHRLFQAFPVPDHGDLIDKQVADDLNAQDYRSIGSDPYTDYARNVVIHCLNAAPVIIPADPGKEVDDG